MYRVGVDIVELARIERAVRRHGDRFLRRVYTEAELAYCRGDVGRLAARWAAKEAISKALGTGWRGIEWYELEVIREPSGQPQVALHGRAKAIAEELGLTQWALSLSHSQTCAVAFVIVTAMSM
ncbi:MAG: holo-ACP synthase [Anaerolineae bacterium]|nr:holo-ACP synthase [Anaerolineae bacterium]